MLYLLDRSLSLLAIVNDYYELLWDRRFDGAGEVRARLSGDYFEVAKRSQYLCRSEYRDLALIDRVGRESDGSVTVRGREAKAMLASRVISSALPSADHVVSAMLNALNQNALSGERAIPMLRLLPLPNDLLAGGEFLGGGEGSDLLTLLLSHLSPIGVGVEILDGEDGLDCQIVQGRDLGERVVFSDEYETLSEISYLLHKNPTYNVAYLLMQTREGEPTVYLLDRCKEGEERKECFVDASNLSRRYRNEQGEMAERTEEEFLRLVIDLGERALLGERTEIEIRVATQGVYRYREDFDVGDLVSVKEKETGIDRVMRILSAKESYRKDKNELILRVGEWQDETEKE